jgi:hypothetical protein
MYCPSCGKSIADGSVFCMHCGKPTGLSVPSHEGQTLPSLNTAPAQARNNDPICPICNQMDVVRHMRGIAAESIRLSQSTTSTSGQMIGVSGAVSSGGGKAIAVSAQSFSSVSHSEGSSMPLLISKLIGIYDGIDAHNRSLMGPEPSKPTFTNFPKQGGAPPPIFYYTSELLFRNSLLRETFGDTCSKLYYCARDAGVFVPGEGEFTPVDQLENRLWRYPDVTAGDICEIHYQQWHGVTHTLLIGGLGYNRLLLALAYGTNGVYVAGQQQWSENRNSSHPSLDLRVTQRGCPTCRQNQAGFLSHLRADGWEQVGDDNWDESLSMAHITLLNTRALIVRNNIPVHRLVRPRVV